MDTARWLEAAEQDGREPGRLCRAAPTTVVRSCPTWTGADLLAHAAGFCRTLDELYAGRRAATDPAVVVPADLAADGIAEFFEAFGATAFAAGYVEPTEATLVLELTDSDDVIRHDLPHPGPETHVSGTAPELFLACWHRRDPLTFHTGGERTPLETWPHI